MLTSEEKVRELHKRMDTISSRRQLQKYRVYSTAVFAVCLIITVVMAFAVAGSSTLSSVIIPGSISASIFTSQAAIGYVVIGILAFTLGAMATIFCYRLKKHMEEGSNDRKL